MRSLRVGGHPAITLRAIKEYGLCRKEKVREIIDSFNVIQKGLHTRLTEKGFLRIILIIEDHLKKNKRFLNEENAEVQVLKELSNWFGPFTLKNDPLAVYDLSLLFKEIKSFFKTKKTEMTAFLVEKFIENKLCKGSDLDDVSWDIPNTQNITIEKSGKKSQENIRLLIREYFKRKKLPIAIGFYRRVLSDKNFSQKDVLKSKFSFGKDRFDSSKSSTHSSTIIGMVKDKGKCSYVLRNAHGASCRGIKYPCLEIGTKSNAAIIIPEDDLLNVTVDVTFFTD